jgi:hypothetical protein
LFPVGLPSLTTNSWTASIWINHWCPVRWHCLCERQSRSCSYATGFRTWENPCAWTCLAFRQLLPSRLWTACITWQCQKAAIRLLCQTSVRRSKCHVWVCWLCTRTAYVPPSWTWSCSLTLAKSLAPYTKNTYTQFIPDTNHSVCWSRAGRVWTESEVQELSHKVIEQWIIEFGQGPSFDQV